MIHQTKLELKITGSEEELRGYLNAAKAAEQLQRRTGLFRKAEEALEEQRAATLKHLVTITILIEASITH